MSAEQRITYTRDELKKLNVYSLRVIPDTERYVGLKKFMRDESRTNLSQIIRRPHVPAYITEKFGSNHGRQAISRGNYRDQRLIQQRRKLYNSKAETPSEKTNEHIRDIVSKLSENNKTKLFAEFRECEIIDECSKDLVDILYVFAADLGYLIPIYVELIFLLRDKNQFVFDQLIDKIIEMIYDPVTFGDEEDDLKKAHRWRIATARLIGGIYMHPTPAKKPPVVTSEQIEKIITMLLQKTLASDFESLETLCELLKIVIMPLMDKNRDFITSVIDQIEPLSMGRAIDKRYRFMIQGVLDLYMQESDEDDN